MDTGTGVVATPRPPPDHARVELRSSPPIVTDHCGVFAGPHRVRFVDQPGCAQETAWTANFAAGLRRAARIHALLVGSANPAKLADFATLLGKDRPVMSPTDLGLTVDVIEDSPVRPNDVRCIMEHAAMKAIAYSHYLERPVLSDDTGLFIHALNGYPGAHVKRCGAEEDQHDAGAASVRRVLHDLKGTPMRRRRAQLITALAYAKPGKKAEIFLGRVNVHIAMQPRGTSRHAIDTVLIPEGLSKTIAQLPPDRAATQSARAVAIRAFLAHIDGQESRRHG